MGWDADVGICPDCEEVTDGHTFHPSCCPHFTVEDQESEGGHWRGWCAECGGWVALMPPEDKDDKAYWEVME
jgi:hypothetical protein